MSGFLRKSPPTRPRSIRPWRRVLALTLFSLVAFAATCCDDSKIKAEEAALKERETKLTEREHAVELRDKEVETKRQALQTDLAALEQRKKDAESQRHDLEVAGQAVEKKKADIEAQMKDLEDRRAKAEEAEDKLKKFKAALAVAAKRGPVPSVTAERVYVFDPRTDEVLFEKNPDKRAPVASTQKLLTSLIVVEAGNLDSVVTVQQGDTECAPVRFGLKAGDQYTRRQLLTALMVRSFNDIAQALARDNAGSIDAFAELMNKRAAKLGMTNSHFVNPHGLPIEDQYSTARDMARVAKQDDSMTEIRGIVCLKEFEFQKNDGKTIKLENTNHVLHSDPNCDGMKTGYTEAAGHCLICSGEKDGLRRIVVVLNDNHNVWKDAQALLEWALKG